MQKQARLEAIAEETYIPMHTVSLTEITPSDIILEMYPSLKGFIQDEQPQAQVV